MDIRKFATNRHAEIHGQWVDIGESGQVKVARLGNPEYLKVLRHKMKPYTREIRDNSLDEKLAHQIYLETLAKTILLNWKGIEENGENIDYSYESAYRFLDEYPEFLRLIESCAENIANFQEDLDRDAEKNLSPRLPGKLSGERGKNGLGNSQAKKETA